MPAKSSALVSIEPIDSADTWLVRVVTHNTKALLARISDALHSANLNILGADLATWPDGAVLDTFEVSSPAPPSAERIQQFIDERLNQFDLSQSVLSMSADMSIDFDDVSHPINTVVNISGADQPGLLSRIASAFSLSDIDVHHALIATTNGEVDDRFEVTDFEGRKLSTALRNQFATYFQ
jgi:UTP:GlnB (protein PII) uridylyltransferase